MKNFKEFLSEQKITEADETANDAANSLRMTLGRSFPRDSWSVGSRNTGIVAMSETGDEETAIKVITDFLERVKAPVKQVKGKLMGATGFKYRDFVINIVDTGKMIKIIVA